VRIVEILFAGAVVVAGAVYTGMAYWMPRGTLAYPGPGFFPMMVGVFLTLAAAACLLQVCLTGRQASASAPAVPADGPRPAASRRVRRAAAVPGFLVAYAALVKPLGFPVAMFLFVLAAIPAFGYRRWFPTLAIATVLAVVSYVTFVAWLKVPLPLGILDHLLD
jgi:hypothetical protein